MFVYQRRVTAEKNVFDSMHIESLCELLLLTYLSFSPHLFLSLTRFYNNTTANVNEWRKKISFWSIYATVCIYHAFLFNIIFFSLFLEHFSVFYLLHSSVQLVRSYTRSRAQRFRDLWEISFDFFVLIFLKPFFSYLCKFSERQQFHRNFWFVLFFHSFLSCCTSLFKLWFLWATKLCKKWRVCALG